MNACLALACWVAALGEPGASAAAPGLAVRIAAPPAVVTDFTAPSTRGWQRAAWRWR